MAQLTDVQYMQEVLVSILREEDIEGLLALGAPEDEYDDEAQQIAEYLASNGKGVDGVTRVEEALTSVLSASFDWDDDEIEHRAEALKAAALRIYSKF